MRRIVVLLEGLLPLVRAQPHHARAAGRAIDVGGGEGGESLAERAREIAVVGVEQADDVAGRCGDAEVERGIESEPRPHQHAQMRVATQHLDRPVGRAAIDDDVLDVSAILRAGALHRLRDEVPCIERWRDDRQAHWEIRSEDATESPALGGAAPRAAQRSAVAQDVAPQRPRAAAPQRTP